MFHEAATRGWDEDELRQLARMWSEESGTLTLLANPIRAERFVLADAS
jgi:hypothetical protein